MKVYHKPVPFAVETRMFTENYCDAFYGTRGVKDYNSVTVDGRYNRHL